MPLPAGFLKKFRRGNLLYEIYVFSTLGTEEQIVRGCLAGKREFQKKLYDTYAGKMLFVCYRYTKDKDEAQDVMQEGFIKVFKNLHTFKFLGSFEGWVRRIMVHTSIEHIRRRKQTTVFDDIENVVHHPESETDASGRLGEKELVRMLHLLPDGYRTVFNLYVIEGYAHKEIAQMLGITEGTSKSQLSKAKEHLKGLLHKYLDTDIEIKNE